jgi:hypothetical protein
VEVVPIRARRSRGADVIGGCSRAVVARKVAAGERGYYGRHA